MANQQQQQTAQISANIGQQESRNQMYKAQGAMNVQDAEARAKKTVMAGEFTRQQGENQRKLNLMDLKAGRQEAKREFKTSMRGANQQMLGGIGDIVGAGLTGFAAGGGFSKGGFQMDTFLGRESGTGINGLKSFYPGTGNEEAGPVTQAGQTSEDGTYTDFEQSYAPGYGPLDE